MEAFKSISKMMSSIEDIQVNANSNDILAQYKRNVKQFIKNITSQVWEIIDKYQKQIKYLRQENKKLKQRNSQTKELPLQTPSKNTNSKPIKKTSEFEGISIAKSQFFIQSPPSSVCEQQKFSTILQNYKKSKNDENNFPVQLINGEQANSSHNGKSIFQIRANHKKQRQQELRNFLQVGQKSLNDTTRRFFSSIGKDKKVAEQDMQEAQGSDSSVQVKKKEEILNQSLGNICNNLDNSIIAKRARSQKKKSSQFEQQAQKKKQQQIAQLMKQRGIQNLLLRLRQNVQSSPTKSPEIIKSTRLTNFTKSVDRDNKNKPNSSKSKVLIIPVAVDIAKKSKAVKQNSQEKYSSSINKFQNSKNDQTSFSPMKSILKQSSVLTKSIAGISAIQFAE